MNTKTASIIIGFTFIAVGLLGFIENPVIGDSDNAIFHADTLHNMVHIVSGVLFLLVALAAPGSAAIFLKVFGAIYFLIGILGFISIGTAGMGEITRLSIILPLFPSQLVWLKKIGFQPAF